MIQSLKDQDKERLFQLAERLTGSCQQGKYRREVLAANVLRRMGELGLRDFPEYLRLAERDSVEHEKLVSCLTIHTTSWFRETPHFEKLEKTLREWKIRPGEPFRALSAACSTGEETYSLALTLEGHRLLNPGFEYEILGFDLDPVSVKHAQKAVYRDTALSEIPKKHSPHLLQGSGPTRGYMTLSKEIRRRCRFEVQNLVSAAMTQKFDWIFCRNVLIYFAPSDVEKIVAGLSRFLSPNGLLCLGHSEAIQHERFKLRALGNSTYSLDTSTVASPRASKSERKDGKTVLVVDDSATIRHVLGKVLNEAGFTSVMASSAAEASAILASTQVHLVTLDLHMPGKDGRTWLKEIRGAGFRQPVVVISDTSEAEAPVVLGALEDGAQDYIEKRKLQESRDEIRETLLGLVADVPKPTRTGAAIALPKTFAPELILLGASTGGTEALASVLKDLPKPCPPVLVVQHISPNFARPFAERLASIAGLKLGKMEAGEPLESDRLYVALQDYHIGIRSSGGLHRLETSQADHINRHRPSVDFLFRSALAIHAPIAAYLLTGMGRDGAEGLAALKSRGALTFAQSKESCVVFGMPNEAIKLGGASHVGDLGQLRDSLKTLIAQTQARKAKAA